MKRIMLRRCFFAVELLILWRLGVAYAADVDFEINTGATYDSNIHRTAAPQEDTYLTLAPRIALKFPLNRSHFSSGVRASIEQHMNIANANLQELVLFGIGRYNYSDHVSFGLLDEVMISDRLQAAEKLTDVTRKREFMDNRFLSAFKYELKDGLWITSLEYANVIRDYGDTEKDDWAAYSMLSRTEYFFGHRTSTQIEFGVLKKSYQADITYISIPVTASLKREIGSKINASFLLGLESRGYNEVYRDRDLDEPTVSLNITGEFTPKTSSRLLFQRKVYDSDVITGYAFASTAADMALVLDLSDAVRLVFQGFYSRNSYIEIERMDNVFGSCVEIKHSFSEWGAVVLSYEHEQRYSSIPNNDYQKDKIDLSYVILF